MSVLIKYKIEANAKNFAKKVTEFHPLDQDCPEVPDTLQNLSILHL
jgi:hypothetical protein